jgi:hypothetical protein
MKMQATSNIATSGRQRDSKVDRLFDVLSIDLSYLLLPKGANRSETRKHHMRRLEAFRVLGNIEFQHIPQHIIGVLMLHATCDIDDSRDAKAGFMAAAFWISGAAKLGVAESQFVYGELFRYGIFSDVHMRFARKYTRRASVQGHVRAIASMKELRSCLLCGVDDAPLMCACCRQARYCDAACSGKHWCEGGGVGGGAGEFAPSLEPHKTTCPRTHRTRRQDQKAAKKAAVAARAKATAVAAAADVAMSAGTPGADAAVAAAARTAEEAKSAFSSWATKAAKAAKAAAAVAALVAQLEEAKNAETEAAKVEATKAEAEKALATETEKAKAEAEKAKAETEKAKAENAEAAANVLALTVQLKDAEAEVAKAEAAKAEAAKAEAEAAKAEAETAKAERKRLRTKVLAEATAEAEAATAKAAAEALEALQAAQDSDGESKAAEAAEEVCRGGC